MEAVLRKHRIVCNRNRDTVLYSLLNSDWEDAEVKIKMHVGLSLKPVMHNAIEIDSGRDIEKQIKRDKELQQQQLQSGVDAKASGGSVSTTSKSQKKKKK